MVGLTDFFEGGNLVVEGILQSVCVAVVTGVIGESSDCCLPGESLDLRANSWSI